MQIRRHANDSLERRKKNNYKTPVKFIDNIDPQRNEEKMKRENTRA